MAIRTAFPISADDASLGDLEEIDKSLDVRLGLGILDQLGLGFFEQQAGLVQRAVGALQRGDRLGRESRGASGPRR
jgi:hypothetical protein